MPPVDPLSTSSLYIESFFDETRLGSATGFLVREHDSYYLVTNRHVLSGRHPETNKCAEHGGVPNRVEVHHHYGEGFGRWRAFSYSLLDSSGNPSWIGDVRPDTDVAVLPLQDIDKGINVWPLDLTLATVDMILRPGMPVFIIGFPCGLKNLESLPIWKTGHIASDPNTNFDNKGCFLIDATTRQGMSGAPVVSRMFGGYESSKGLVSIYSKPTTKFIGIYSGRLSKDSEIGIVWKPHVLFGILNSLRT